MSNFETLKLHKLKTKDSATLKELYIGNFFKARAYILKNNGSEVDAKDIFQEAIIILWRNMNEEKFVPDNWKQVEAYLFQTVKNKWLDILRRKKRTLSYTLINAHPPFEAEPYDEKKEEQLNVIERCFRKLEEPCKTILKRFYYHNESYSTIAKSLSYSEQTLKTMKYRCLKKFKKIIAQHQDK